MDTRHTQSMCDKHPHIYIYIFFFLIIEKTIIFISTHTKIVILVFLNQIYNALIRQASI